MFEELEYEYSRFLDDMKRGETFCRYLDEDEYEDEYSHNEIDECQRKLAEKIEAYLKKTSPASTLLRLDGAFSL